MQDRLFFPLAFVLASTFILMALQPFAERCATGPVSGGGRSAEDVTVQGREFCRFQPGSYDSIEIVAASGDTPAALRITREAGQDYQDPRSGPHLVLAEDIEYALEHRKIQIEIVARAAGDFPASQFEADFFAKAEFETGWQPFNLTTEFQTFRFTFDAPPRGDTEGYDYIGIRPIVPDKHRTMEVRSVRVSALTPKG